MANTERVSEPLQMTSSLHDRMGIEILEATAERVVGPMPVEGNLIRTACCMAMRRGCTARITCHLN